MHLREAGRQIMERRQSRSFRRRIGDSSLTSALSGAGCPERRAGGRINDETSLTIDSGQHGGGPTLTMRGGSGH